MAIFPSTAIPSGASAFTIPYSCRFNAADDAYLSRTQGTPTDGKKWVWSAWVKRGSLINQVLFRGWTGAAYEETHEIKLQSNMLAVEQYKGSGGDNYYYWRMQTDMLFRDTSAWYHICVSYDSTQTTDTNRIKIYVNGSVQTVNHDTYHSHANFPTVDFEGWINEDGSTAQIGRMVAESEFDGYMAEMHFIDGLSFFSDTSGTASTSLNIDTFGETGDYGEWKPKEVSGVTYGTNGFYLDFADSSALGDDESGNTNDFTVTNLVASDQMLDTPTNNFCNFNYNYRRKTDLTEGNLVVKSNTVGATYGASATFLMLSGKWYWEYVVTDASGAHYAGVGKANKIVLKDMNTSAHHWVNQYSASNNKKWHDSTGTTISGGNADGDGHILQIAFDADAGKLWFGKHNTWADSGDPAAGSNECFSSVTHSSGIIPSHGDDAYGEGMTYNFGQDSSFAGAKTAQGNQDSNGIGDFYYTPPSGFLALCSQNLPDVITPSEHFNTILYDDGAGAKTGVGFQPDLVWFKGRGAGYDHKIVDAVRGVQKKLHSNDTTAEGTDSTGLTAFGADGFTVGADLSYSSTVGDGIVAWNWKGGNATLGTGDFTQGNADSTCSRNVDAGFSIVSYTGNSTANRTVGHGLSKAPEMIIIKNRDDGDSWMVYHEGTGTTGTTVNSLPEYLMMFLQSTASGTDYSVDTIWGSTATTFMIDQGGGGAASLNLNTEDYIAYCFHSVEGYSRVGSYVATGTAADIEFNNFIYLGFRPKWMMIKNTNATGGGGSGNWCIVDTERDTYNPANKRLEADSGDVENADGRTGAKLDLCSNGFKILGTAGDGKYEWNWTGQNYIYLAFAETPFKYANAR